MFLSVVVEQFQTILEVLGLMEEGMNFPIVLAILELWPLTPLTNLWQTPFLVPTADCERGFSKQNMDFQHLGIC